MKPSLSHFNTFSIIVIVDLVTVNNIRDTRKHYRYMVHELTSGSMGADIAIHIPSTRERDISGVPQLTSGFMRGKT